MATIHPVILCGGSGTRLWPLSRKSYPKQFSALLDDRSLFQAAALRLQGQAFAAPIIVTADAFRFIVTEQLAEIGIEPAAILIEPEGRNTAPAVLAAAEWLRAAGRGGQMLVAPSDHLIPDEAAFRDAVAGAVPAASAGKLVTFGIRPTRPETGYGWLELSSPEDAGASRPVPLRRFVEKPPPDRAAEMLADGRHLWNAGIFLFSVDAIHDAFTRHAPDMVPPVGRAVERARADLAFTRLDAEAWAAARAESIDYAVMEKAGNLAVMPFRGAWSDLGDWEAIRRVTADDDAAGNATHGPVLALDCENTLLRAESEGQQLVAIGLSDVVAVAMPDAVLVAHASRAQEVKDAVDRMRRDGTRQADSFPRDHRPWGWFETLALGPRFQVKRIVVHPGAALSLQSHVHRAEHWVVVEGTARVTIGDDVRLVGENESVYIPLGARHRLENPGKLPLTLIEVQTGSYLGEDDIVRYEDVYARK